MLVAPCGMGKTVISAEIMRSGAARGTRSLFVADRCTLVDQTLAKLAMAGVTGVRVIQAERDEGPRDAMVTVASAQTLRTAKWIEQLPPADLVIWDECHGIVARTFRRVLDRYPNARLLGLTATPCRGDNRPLDTFDELVVGATVHELLDDGLLARPHVLRPPQQLGAGEISMDPVAAYIEHAAGQRAAVFCSRVDHADKWAEQYRAARITAEVVDADTPNRADVIARFAANDFQILLSVATLTQGWDDPGCGVAIVARKPEHIGLWLQICGRVLRPFPGKERGLILDLGGASLEHGPPDLDPEYSLTGRGIAPAVRMLFTSCKRCGTVFRLAPTCPHCGFRVEAKPARLPRVTGAGLVDASAPVAEPTWHPMRSKRGGPCSRCGRGITKGDWIMYAPKLRIARHTRCPVTTQPAATT